MVLLGAVVMAAGHFTLSFHDAFFVGLLLIIVGNGCFKPNISVQIGRLYVDEDPRKTTAFFIFYCGINLGAFFAPLVCGALRSAVGYAAGFAAAGVGMGVGLLIYVAGWALRLLPPDREREKSKVTGHSLSFFGQVKVHRWEVLCLITVCAMTVPFWGTYEQSGNTIALYSETMVDRQVGTWEMPTEFVQAINPFFILAMTPAVNAIWAFERRKGMEPTPTGKMAIGLVFVTLSYTYMTLITGEEGGHTIPIVFLIVQSALITWGELYLSPVGLAFVSDYSPPSLTSLMMGCWLLSSFAGNYLAGWIGTFYGRMSHRAFFTMLALVAAAAAAVMYVVGKRVMRRLERSREAFANAGEVLAEDPAGVGGEAAGRQHAA